ncbi:MAG: hypothetical protein PHI12_14710 [Dehalococcoidales bacterium]|nr:hypothetical protein [Dehalococcoidales bacterium]
MDFESITKEELKLYAEKNKDYTQGGDKMGNFKRVASILSHYQLDLSDPVTVCLVYMLKQLDAALWMLSQGYEGDIENVDTRLKDVHVYAKICRILHQEGK